MQLRIVFFTLLACICVPAAADFVTVTKAHEVEVDDLRLPGNDNGTLAFKPCDDCAYQIVRVTDATRYEANDHALTLDEFRAQLAQIPHQREIHATVMHHLESNTITEVHIAF